MKWRWLLVVAMLVIAGGALFVAMGGIAIGGSNAANQYLTAAATRRTVTKAVAATGAVASAATYGLAFGDGPHIGASSTSSGAGASTTWPVTSVSVAVGDSVKKGQALAVADTTDLKDALDKLQTSLASAQVTLQQAQQTKDDARKTTQQSLTAAKASEQVAKIQLKSAKSTLKTDTNNAVAGSILRQDRIGVIQAHSSLAQAEQQVATLASDLAGTFPTETTAVENAQSSVDDLTTQVADQQALIANAVLTSPVDGVVSAVNIVAGYDAPSGDAIDIATNTLQVVADVVESDLSSVSVGQAATVSITAVSADVTGKVTSIAPAATTSGSSSVVTYPVTVTLDQPGATVRAGMSSDISITISQAANVIAVPVAAVHGTTGNYTVQVVDSNGNATTVAVTVGLISDTYAEIQSGIAEGDSVVIGTLSSTAQSTGGSTTTGAGAFPISGGFGGGTFGGGGTRVGR